MTTTKQRRVSFDDRDDRTDERHNAIGWACRHYESPFGEVMDVLGIESAA